MEACCSHDIVTYHLKTSVLRTTVYLKISQYLLVNDQGTYQWLLFKLLGFFFSTPFYQCELFFYIRYDIQISVAVPARPGFRPGCLFFSYIFSMKAGTPATVLPWSERKFPPLRAKWYTLRGIWLISCLMRAVRKVSSAVDVEVKLIFKNSGVYFADNIR